MTQTDNWRSSVPILLKAEKKLSREQALQDVMEVIKATFKRESNDVTWCSVCHRKQYLQMEDILDKIRDL